MQPSLAVALKKESKEKNREQEFLDFVNRDGIQYEKILLKRYYDRVKAILEGGNPPPYELEIQPSSDCNANCIFCFGRESKKLENKLYTKKAMDRIVEQALNFKIDNFKIDIIKFCGSTGDPLKNIMTLYAIEKIYGKRFLRLFTNAITFAENKDNLDYLTTASKVNRLNASLDAASTEMLHKLKPGSKNVKLEDILIALNKIRSLSKKGIDVEASYVINNHNYKDTAEFARKVKYFGAADRVRFRIDLTDRIVSENHGDEINDLLEQAKSYKNESFGVVPIHSGKEVEQKEEGYFSSKNSGFECFTSRLWACIGSNGNIYPCGHVVSEGVENYGNLLEQSFREIWDSDKKMALCNNLPIDECKSCSPFSLRANRFLTHISKWESGEIDKLREKYIENG